MEQEKLGSAYALKIIPEGHEENPTEKLYLLVFRHPNKEKEFTLRKLPPPNKLTNSLEAFAKELYHEYVNYFPPNKPDELGEVELKIPGSYNNRRLNLKLENKLKSKKDGKILETARFAEDSNMPDPYRGNKVYLKNMDNTEKAEFIRILKETDKKVRKDRRDNSN